MNDCGLGPVSPGLEIDILPAPAIPSKPAGPEFVDQYLTPESTYTTEGSEFSLNYVWAIEPQEAGTLTTGETGLDCTVAWSSEFTGEVSVMVRGLNDCGEGEFSEALAVTVANTVGVPETGPELKVSILPNPSSGSFRISILSGETTKAQLMLYSSTGRLVWGPVDATLTRAGSLPVTLESIPEGLYVLRVETGNGISQHKVLIIN
jgi:hypothetical protein